MFKNQMDISTDSKSLSPYLIIHWKAETLYNATLNIIAENADAGVRNITW